MRAGADKLGIKWPATQDDADVAPVTKLNVKAGHGVDDVAPTVST